MISQEEVNQNWFIIFDGGMSGTMIPFYSPPQIHISYYKYSQAQSDKITRLSVSEILR